MTNNSISLTPKQVRLIEKLAVTSERRGMPPAMAKIGALLIVSDKTELSFEQIMDTLGLSKGATSQALNQLLVLKHIEYRTRLGDRKRYFFSRIASWTQETLSDFDSMFSVIDLLQEILKQRPKETNEFNEGLRKLIAFLSFLNREMPELFKKFEASYK